LFRFQRGLFLNNDLAEGRLRVAGRRLALDDMKLPMFVVGTEHDHIARASRIAATSGVLSAAKDSWNQIPSATIDEVR